MDGPMRGFRVADSGDKGSAGLPRSPEGVVQGYGWSLSTDGPSSAHLSRPSSRDRPGAPTWPGVGVRGPRPGGPILRKTPASTSRKSQCQGRPWTGRGEPEEWRQGGGASSPSSEVTGTDRDDTSRRDPSRSRDGRGVPSRRPHSPLFKGSPTRLRVDPIRGRGSSRGQLWTPTFIRYRYRTTAADHACQSTKVTGHMQRPSIRLIPHLDTLSARPGSRVLTRSSGGRERRPVWKEVDRLYRP